MERMKNIGDELVKISDQLEPHGLADYELGLWEEEILSGQNASHSFLYIIVLLFTFLGQCIDLAGKKATFQRPA